MRGIAIAEGDLLGLSIRKYPHSHRQMKGR